MATCQRKIKPEQKRQLVAEAGGKCANPGCAHWRLHIHHILHWSVYKTHDSEHMIAICPTCHDAAHYGPLKISDDTLYSWKGIERPAQPFSITHISIEPSYDLKLLAGPIAFQVIGDQLTVFKLSNRNHLSFRVLAGDILQVSAQIEDEKGKLVLQIDQNIVRVFNDTKINFLSRPGQVQIYMPAFPPYVPTWLLDLVQNDTPLFGRDGRVLALDMEVLKPGLIRIEGCWADADKGIIITPELISFYRQGNEKPMSFGAYGAIGDEPPIILATSSNLVMFGSDTATSLIPFPLY